MDIYIGSDHGALELKNSIVNYLQYKQDIEAYDLGTEDTQSVDYPDFADRVVKSVLSNSLSCGILCCGTGIGISIRANRFKGIRAALVYDAFTAQMAKEHNNANVLCFGGRTSSLEDVKTYIDIWLKASFEGGRHQRRLDKLDASTDIV